MDSNTERLLSKYWAQTFPDNDVSISMFNYLVKCYSQDHRFYHTGEHIYDMLYEIELEFSYNSRKVEYADEDAIMAAAFYHDIVYAPRAEPFQNERASANVAYAQIVAMGCTEGFAISVSDLIMVTAGHEAKNPDEGVLIDADLGILSEAHHVYQRYVKNLRKEYSFANDEQWHDGRSKFLEGMIARDRIYYDGTVWWQEEQAIENMTFELNALKEGAIVDTSDEEDTPTVIISSLLS